MMNLVFVLVTVSVVLGVRGDSCPQYDLVNGFVATSGPGFGYGGINPGAQVPFSPLRLGPDTMSSVVDISYLHFSGYNYMDNTVRGFSHTHLVGGGVNDLGTIGVMPVLVESPNPLDYLGNFSSRFWWSELDKASESASPGLYSVTLSKPQVEAELLAVKSFTGVHRYTWKSTDLKSIPGVVVDICHAAKLAEGLVTSKDCLEASLEFSSDLQSFSGSVYFSGHLSGNIWVHVYGELSTNRRDTKFTSWHSCTGFEVNASCSTASTTSSSSGVLFSLGTLSHSKNQDDAASSSTSDLVVELRVGISFLSQDQAKVNFQDSFGSGEAFETLAARTRSIWCDQLSLLTISPLEGDDSLSPMLFSAAYRSFMSPTQYSEVGGLYLGVDGQLHNVTADRIARYGDSGRTASPKAYEFYSDLSFWDTFRTQHPWLLLVDEDLAVGVARSVAEITVQQQAFPRWVLASHEASCMIGLGGSAAILEAIDAGLGSKIDVASIQPILLRQSTQPNQRNGRTDVEHYISAGYVSKEAASTGTSLTVQFAFDDFVLAGISDFVGDHSAADAARNRSKNYAFVFASDREFICPRSVDGSFDCPKDPIGPESWNSNTEGNDLHYTWHVPQDPKGLVSLFPSPEEFDAKLEDFFFQHVAYHQKYGSFMPNPYYWAGNEHSSFTVWLFNYGPNCTRSQYWSRRLTEMHYSNTPHGIPGNEDYGAMSSWLLFASLGLFPRSGTTEYVIGSPRVQDAILTARLFDGSKATIHVQTHNNSAENVFVERLLVNGVEQRSPFLDRSVLLANGGAHLEFYMSSEPVSGLCSK